MLFVIRAFEFQIEVLSSFCDLTLSAELDWNLLCVLDFDIDMASFPFRINETSSPLSPSNDKLIKRIQTIVCSLLFHESFSRCDRSPSGASYWCFDISPLASVGDVDSIRQLLEGLGFLTGVASSDLSGSF